VIRQSLFQAESYQCIDDYTYEKLYEELDGVKIFIGDFVELKDWRQDLINSFVFSRPGLVSELLDAIEDFFNDKLINVYSKNSLHSFLKSSNDASDYFIFNSNNIVYSLCFELID
jgi:hypothetical protein